MIVDRKNMKYETIEQIYLGNSKVRGRLKSLLSTLTDDQISARPEGEKWSVADIVEHIAMVDEGAVKICAKLLKKAEEAGNVSDGKVTISDEFLQKGVEIAAMKVEAPSFVRPSGQKTISESLARLDESDARLAEMRGQFESVGATEFKFPHPFFGDITAHEWLALKGGHEMRHIKQIQNVLDKVG